VDGLWITRKMRSKKPTNEKDKRPALTLRQAAKACGVSTNTVHQWCERDGLASESTRSRRMILLADLLRFLARRADSKAAGGTGQRDRLAKEQADKIAIENAISRGELIYAAHAKQIRLEAITMLAGQLDGISGRFAIDLAAESDASVIRVKLRDEHRRIRSAYARSLGELADLCDRRAGLPAGDGTAPDQVGVGVGGRESNPSARKRGARAVAK